MRQSGSSKAMSSFFVELGEKEKAKNAVNSAYFCKKTGNPIDRVKGM